MSKKLCPFTKEPCREDCALFLKEIEIPGMMGKPVESGDVRSVTTGCAIAVLATR